MILLIDKPTGMTSYDVIRRLKKKYPWEKIGHSGTLDPLATWLLLIGLGKWTKQLHRLQWMNKSYEAVIDFSQMSDTWDVDFWKEHQRYEILEKKDEADDIWKESLWISKDDAFVPAPCLAAIEKKIWLIVWWETLLPLTPFSAKKYKWKKLYEYARAGNPIIMDSPMSVLWYEILDYQFPVLRVSFSVWSGTYIRSLAFWLWREFWLWGILTSLRRTSIGDYDVKDAEKLVAMTD